MQNRESAVRSRHKKKEGIEYIKSENDILKKENYHLSYENYNLKKEKNFLIDQIKFMQNLIKSHGMLIKSDSCSNENNDIEKNVCVKNLSTKPDDVSYSTQIKLNGERQKPFTKIFSVFLICILSVFYITFNNDDLDSNQKIVFNGGSTITLNDASERNISNNNNNSLMKLITSSNIITKVLIVLALSFFILNAAKIWRLIKKISENNKKLYKSL